MSVIKAERILLGLKKPFVFFLVSHSVSQSVSQSINWQVREASGGKWSQVVVGSKRHKGGKGSQEERERGGNYN